MLTSNASHLSERILGISLNLVALAVAIIYSLIIVSHSTLYIHEKYIHPILDASDQYKAYASEDMSEWMNRDAVTYTERYCSEEEISATTQEEVVWNSENREEYESFSDLVMVHGAGMLHGILKNETITSFRETIIRMNLNEPKWKQFDLKEHGHRWSLRVNPYDNINDSDGIVRKALKEIASHTVLKSTLEELLGPDPAIVEISAITSEPGAEEQAWHYDVWQDSSGNQFARKYVQQYSLFLYLQDTYTDMGSTGFCMGSHMCAELSDEAECFFVEPPAGSGVLLNSATMHQGSGNTAFHRKDGTRVMFIVTFATKPNPETDHRMLPLGSVFGIPWYIWNHNLSELLSMDIHRWNIFHALGITKHGKHWGWNVLLGLIAAHGENGSNGNGDEEWFLEKSSWEELHDQVYNLAAWVIPAYLVLVILSSFYSIKQGRSWTSTGFTFILRFGVSFTSLVAILIYVFSCTDFARGIKNGERFRQVPFKAIQQSDFTDEYIKSITYPSEADILYGERLDAYYLYKSTFFYDYHPGNKFFLELVKDTNLDYLNKPHSFQRQYVSEYLYEDLFENNARFLEQNEFGHWVTIPREKIDDIVRKEIIGNAFPILRRLSKEIDFILSQCKYGDGARKKSIFMLGSTSTALSQTHIPYFMRQLKQKLYYTNDRSGVSFTLKSIESNENRPVFAPSTFIEGLDFINTSLESRKKAEKSEMDLKILEIQEKMLEFGVMQKIPTITSELYETANEAIEYMQPFYSNVTDGVFQGNPTRQKVDALIRRRDSCINKSPNCLLWATVGYCEEHYEIMIEGCGPSCGTCLE